MDVVNYTLTEDTIEETKETSVFGSEKNRLVVEPLGQLVLEFLDKNFDELLNYEYTRDMEVKLDHIARGQNTKSNVCSEYYSDISKHLKQYKDGNHSKVSYRFDDEHEYIIGAHGPVIKRTVGEDVTWKKVKSGVTLEQVRDGGVKLEDVVDNENEDRTLGTFKDVSVILKNGRYGPYVVYGGKNIGMKSVDKQYSKITIADVIDLLDDTKGESTGNPSVLRVISPYISIRKGKFGNYIYYKTTKMTKPKFVKLGALKETFMTCDKKDIVDLVDSSNKDK